MQRRAALVLSILLAWTVVSARSGQAASAAHDGRRRDEAALHRRRPDLARRHARSPTSCPGRRSQKNEHEAALFIVPAGGGAADALGDTVRIFNAPTPRPQLRWSPDGKAVSLVGFDANGRPAGVCDSDRRQLRRER